MNKTIKGSLAAGAAAVLLLGGAGSLAYWTDDALIDGGTINSGFLYLESATENGAAKDCTDFIYADGFAGSPAPVDFFVPGDVVETTCTFTIRAEGANLAAEPSVTDEVEVTSVDGPSFVATAESVLTVNGVPYDPADPITDESAGDALVATITVTIPFGDDDVTTNGNDTKEIEAALSALQVTLTQLDPNA